MQSENEFIDQENAAQEAYRYFMSVDPAMRDFLGPIEHKHDALTGRTLAQREAKIGMIRGASLEDMTTRTVYLEPFPHIRTDKGKDLQGWYSNKHDGDSPNQRDRPCETDAILTQPYGGYCAVGCTFCYINSGTRGYRGSGLISVPLNYGEHVRKQLRSMKVSAAGYFSSFTDPFTPLEDYYRNTQSGAEAFADLGLPVFFLSRLAYPGWAYDLLKRSPYSYAQKSINTWSEEVWRRISPGALSLSDHFAEIRELRRRGIYVSIQLNPVIPGIMSHADVVRTIEALGEAGANHIIVKFVEASHSWAKAMVERLSKKFPERSIEFRELFTENQAGGQKTIAEDYRREGHTQYQAAATRLGMTYALCYEYTRKDGRWKSMGPEFLTGDQCHGHRVPMHQLNAASGLFEPMEVCPPSGCLRCADEHTEALCGSELLTEARALRLPDLRNPFKKTIPLTEVK